MALNNVPLAGQNLVQTRDAINQNFITFIDTQFAVDHVAFNTSGAGKHNKVTMPVQGSSPSFAAGENGIYNLNNATTTKNEIYFHKQTQAGTAEIPVTASILSNNTPITKQAGWTYLPSGLIMVWGQNVISNSVATTVNLSFTIPNQILNIQISPSGLGNSGSITGQVSVQNVPNGPTISSFTAQAQGSSNVSAYWLVIGY